MNRDDTAGAIFIVLLFLSVVVQATEAKVKVATTLPDYAAVVGAIGGERVEAKAIVMGNQDAHFIRPKPSFVSMVRKADLLVSTGLDLELWLPTVVDKSGNARVRSGASGYVAASRGITLLEKPKVLSKSEGDVHIYGNPHINTSPLNMRVIAENITQGLLNVDPEGEEFYRSNLRLFIDRLDRRMFGEELVDMLGGDRLVALARKKRLHSFLRQHEVGGKPLIDYLGGWSRRMAPLKGKEVVTYHKNWVYLLDLFGIVEAGTVEPKPGIPPTPKHVEELMSTMRTRQIKLIISANYFDESKVKMIAGRVGAEAVILPLYVGGADGVDDYFELVEYWVEHTVRSAAAVGMISSGKESTAR